MNNLKTVQFVPSNKIYHLWARFGVGVMAINGYSKFSKTPKLQPHHPMLFSVMPKKLFGGGLTLLEGVQ